MASRLASAAPGVAGMDDMASRCHAGPLLVLLVLLVLRGGLDLQRQVRALLHCGNSPESGHNGQEP